MNRHIVIIKLQTNYNTYLKSHFSGGNANSINPQCPADLVIDHSVQVDFSGSKEALSKNEALEFERNKERFTFLKWGAGAFSNMLIIPPGSGIVHQVKNISF